MILDNKMSTKRITSVEFVFLIYVSITYLFTTNYVMFSFYSRISDYVSLVLFLIMILVSRKFQLKNLVFFILLSITISFCTFMNVGGIGSIITMLSPLLLLFSLANVTFSKQSKKYMVLLAGSFLIFAFVKSFFYRADWMYHRFHDVNPNTMGMFTLASFAIVLSFLRSSNRKKTRLLFFAISIVSLVNFESRWCTLTLLLVLLADYAAKRVKNTKIFIFVIVVIIAIGSFFPYFYMSLYRNSVELTLLNKSLYTGREIIWLDMFSRFASSPKSWLIGLGSHFSGEGINIHNNFFAVIVNFGLVGYFLYFGFLFIQLRKILLNSTNKETNLFVLIFVCIAFFLGFTEVTTLWSVTYPFMYMFLGIAMSEVRRNNYEWTNS